MARVKYKLSTVSDPVRMAVYYRSAERTSVVTLTVLPLIRHFNNFNIDSVFHHSLRLSAVEMVLRKMVNQNFDITALEKMKSPASVFTNVFDGPVESIRKTLSNTLRENVLVQTSLLHMM